MTDALGDRMKLYESRETARACMPGLPTYARIDGRCFSRFTKGLDRPYDMRLSAVMISVTKALVEETNAVIGYTQSDEISLLWDAEKEMLFGGKFQKLSSVLAGIATASFIVACANYEELHNRVAILLPSFDCRVFQLPNKTEAVNTLIWREQDATKNAISMAARCLYSHKELQDKTGPEMQGMIFERGHINFNDYPVSFKRGTYVRKVNIMRSLSKEEKEKIPEEYRPKGPVMRSEIKAIEMPVLSRVMNRVDVIFDGAEPILAVV